MGNQYFRLKLDIEKAKELYNLGLTQKEVGKKLETTQRIIQSRFREINFKSRIYLKKEIIQQNSHTDYIHFIKDIDEKTKQILLGSLFGDGSIRMRLGGISPQYVECHQLRQSDYLNWKITYFKKYLGGKLSIVNKHSTPVANYVSNALINLFYFYKLFYPYGKKELTKELLQKLDWQGIAVWYVDDGTFDYSGKRIAFTMDKKFHNICIEYFKELGFFFKLSYPNSLAIRLSTKQTKKFIKNIESYIFEMPKCVHYKIGLNKYEKNAINN